MRWVTKKVSPVPRSAPSARQSPRLKKSVNHCLAVSSGLKAMLAAARKTRILLISSDTTAYIFCAHSRKRDRRSPYGLIVELVDYLSNTTGSARSRLAEFLSRRDHGG